jgi:hypothetical protein
MSRTTTEMIITEAAATDSRSVPGEDGPSPLPAAGMDGAARPSPAASRSSFQFWHPLVVAAGLLAIIAVARPVAAWHVPFPQCWLRKFTGLPCPTCGCTRSLLAWAQLDPGQAFFFNPLFCLLCAGVLLWPVVAAFEEISGREWLSRAWARVPRRRAWQVAAVLAALNWLYLCLRLPK